MRLTDFPFETEEPVVDVVLPIGSHTLKLIVEDDAGVKSPPDEVVVTIKSAPDPVIESVEPNTFAKGTSVDAFIRGDHLLDVVAVKLYRGSQEDDRVDVDIRDGGTDVLLPITVTVMEHALSGARTLAVITESGTATAEVTILPTEGIKVYDVSPQRGLTGKTTAVRVIGDNLEDVNRVSFLYDGQQDEHIQAAVRISEPDRVDTDVSISVNAAFASRTVSLASPTDEGQSQPGIFTVLPGYTSLAIMLLTLITAVIHISLSFSLPSPDYLYYLFILNGLGYLDLLIALYTSVPRSALNWRPAIRWLLLAYTLLTIVLWVAIGERWVGAYVTKLVEALLVLMLFVESRKA